ncbi:MAG TPA: TraB/GumN family protein [Chthoniobacterales bacterium]|nr:TraB/GumN family protein [Chthoniobacterales bacterium]
MYGWAATTLNAASVWKVSASDGSTIYLGGSMHALTSKDYPLPGAYTRALDASSRLILEVDEKAVVEASKSLGKAGEYPHNDSLKNHVDPRTYNYLTRLLGLLGISPDKFSRYRPWFLALLLESPAFHGRSEELGVERYLIGRAHSNRKPVGGLESAGEHAEIFSGLSDQQSEAYLLLEFIPQSAGVTNAQMMQAWRKGDADAVAREFHNAYADFPSLAQRLLDNRNQKWMPKIENYLQTKQTCFVVVGVAHLGGPNGLVALLRARGYKIEQL